MAHERTRVQNELDDLERLRELFPDVNATRPHKAPEILHVEVESSLLCFIVR